MLLKIHPPPNICVLRDEAVKVISVRVNPEYKNLAIKYFQDKWADENSLKVYADCIENAIGAQAPLPHWYLLFDGKAIAGGAGLISNDFISRMDLYPWLCALYIERQYRGRAYGALLIEQAKSDAKNAGFKYLYLGTDHVGYYEHYDFEYIATGYHPWGDSSRIYRSRV